MAAQITVEEQLEILRKVTADALKSKELRLQLLTDVGLIKKKKPSPRKPLQNKRK